MNVPFDFENGGRSSASSQAIGSFSLGAGQVPNAHKFKKVMHPQTPMIAPMEKSRPLYNNQVQQTSNGFMNGRNNFGLQIDCSPQDN